MQAFLGTILFAVVCIFALVVAIARGANIDGLARLVSIAAQFVGIVAAVYTALAITAGIAWLVAWIGIYLRYFALWLLGILTYPWSWIF